MSLGALLVVALAASLCLAQEEGSRCVTKYNGARGVCKITTSCVSAAQQSALLNIKPTICGYVADTPVVCCEDQDLVGMSITPTKIPPSALTTNGMSVEKCKEYSRLAMLTVAALPLVVDPEPVLATTSKCHDALPLIVGGNKTAVGEFPHMAAIGYGSANSRTWGCGGSLISERYVITAAHCARARNLGSPSVVRLGEQNLNSDDDGANPIDVPVSEVVVHPNYKYPQKYNDVALLKLDRDVRFTENIRPACLWSTPEVDGSVAVATGWGKTSFTDNFNNDDLLKVPLSLIKNPTCNDYKADKSYLPNGITSSMLCAGELEGGRDTCQGDSGGPLQITSQNNSCIFHLVGVTSFGKGCADPGSPGIYTRISSFVPWIERTVWP